ncbi:MAG: hypothetical protein ACRENN_01520 [Candidatus Eiseniibacteriota bacterium]
MIKPWIWIYVLSLGIGLAVGAVAPPRWGLGPTQSLLLGSAIYFGGLKRYVAWRVAEWARAPGSGRALGALLPGVASRIAGVLLIAWLQAYVCFDSGRIPDVRLGFVVVSTWLVAQGMIDRPERAGVRPARAEG